MLPAEAHAEQQQTAAPPLAENEVVKAEAVEIGANDAKLTEQEMNAMESNVKQDNAGYIDESLWENTEEDDLSDQWSSRWSFVLAAIGSAVGLGNFWRFPFQVYEYGGGTFFIPYLLALFFVGIPTMQLEMAVGQVFRRSALQSFGRLHPRMAGVGLAAAWFSFALVTYYVAILAWGNVMFIKSFYKDMPFSIRDVVANESRAPMDVINVPAGHFGDVILSGSPSTVIPKTISAGLMMGALFMWVTVWLILTKGQEFVSKAVWVTVLMPCFMLLLLLIVGATLEGAGVGIEKYLAEWDFSTLSDGGMWTDAFGQVFFSLSIAYGIMPAYASLNPRNSDIVKDAVIVSICDAVFSFFAGFAVFTIVGFFSVNSGFTIDQLGGKEPSIVDGEEVTLNVLGGATLAFVTYPAGLSLLNGYWANITCVMFFVTFFFLGVDSAFSLIEACVLTMRETVWFADWTKSNLTTLVVFVAAMCNLLFITDNGIYYLDFADVYIATLGVFLIGFLESLTAGWIFNKSMSKYKVGANAVNAFDGLFWTGLLLFIILGYQLPESTDLTQGAIYGVALGVGLVFIAAAFASVALLKPSSMSLGDAYYWACLHGVDSLKDMLNRTITKDRPKNWAFTRAWAISIKFLVCPTLFILLGTKTSGLVKSGGYDGGVSDPIADHFFGFFNFFGCLFIVVAIVCVLGSIFFPEKYNDVRTGVLALRRKNKENL